jgi:hypothetical protein
MPDDEGGTVIKRNNGSRPPPQMMQQQQPTMEQQMMHQQMMQQQMAQQQMAQQQMAQPPELQFQPKLRGILKPTSFTFNDSKFKKAVLVAIIFVILNSRIVWTQITKLPFMGGLEPSILALIVNSILAGLVFYIISNVM